MTTKEPQDKIGVLKNENSELTSKLEFIRKADAVMQLVVRDVEVYEKVLQAPSDGAFEEMKQACLLVWETMDNTYGYVDEKTSKIKDIQNIGDNFMHMFAMFDAGNQMKAVHFLKEDTREALRARLVDGGNDEYFIANLNL